MGDRINNIRGLVINRSTINNAFNRIEGKLNQSDISLLEGLTHEIEKSKNRQAIENIEDFHEELGKETPKVSRLKAFWSGITEAIPTLLANTDKVLGIIEKVQKVVE